MTRMDEVEKKIAELEAQQAAGDYSRVTELRLQSFRVLRAGFPSWRDDDS